MALFANEGRRKPDNKLLRIIYSNCVANLASFERFNEEARKKADKRDEKALEFLCEP